MNVASAISSFILSSQELQDPVTCLRKRAGVSDYEKREIMYIVYYANTKDPDQSAHLHILIRILTLNRYILQ